MATYDQKNPYSWMPGFLRRFMHLEYDELPVASAGTQAVSYASPSVATPVAQSTPSSVWSPPSQPSFNASNMESYTPPASSGFTLPSVPSVTNGGGASGEASITIMTIPQALQGFLHGILPPQGLQAFTKEVIDTTGSVWGMYSRLVGFQSEDVIKAGRDLLKKIVDLIPTSSSPSTPARRIKVMIANGETETPVKIEG